MLLFDDVEALLQADITGLFVDKIELLKLGKFNTEIVCIGRGGGKIGFVLTSLTYKLLFWL